MQGHLEERLETVERALTDGEADLGSMAAGAARAERVEALEARLDDLADEVDELDASLQAVRGYVGEIRAVNSEVEETAAAAMATAERATEAEGERDSGHGQARRSTMDARRPTSPDSPSPERSPHGPDPGPKRSARGRGAERSPPRAHEDPTRACPTCGGDGQGGRSPSRDGFGTGGDGWQGDIPTGTHDERAGGRELAEWPPGEPGDADGETASGGMVGRVRSLL